LEKAVKEELLRGDGWLVYENYKITYENGEQFVVAPMGPLTKRVKERPAEDGRRPTRYRLREPAEDAAVCPYAPLRTPELVRELADMADEPITPEAVVRWAEVYGLLGCTREDDVVETVLESGEKARHEGWGRRDSVARFAEAAGEVRVCLRAFEAAKREGPVNLEELSNSLGPLPPIFWEVLEPWKRHKTVERPWLYGVIGRTVQTRIREHCYLKLAIFTRSGNPSGRFGLGYAFDSLLGAIWLLLAQLLDSQNVTYCRLPDCGRVINFEPGEQVPADAPRGARKRYKTRKDKVFCDSDKRPCRQNYWYRKKAGWPSYS
jgi:hypothetical protein